MPDARPGPGEVRIAVAVSGLRPVDVKKRSGWQGAPMDYPRVVPQSDGAGVIDAVGPGVDERRVGRRAWCYGAQSYRPFGTAAGLVVVPAELEATGAFSASEPELASAIRLLAPGGVHRIAEVDFAEHIDLDAEVLAVGGVISSYATPAERPEIPYWRLRLCRRDPSAAWQR